MLVLHPYFNSFCRPLLHASDCVLMEEGSPLVDTSEAEKVRKRKSAPRTQSGVSFPR